MKYKKLYNELYENGYHSNYNTCHTRSMFNKLNSVLEKGKRVLDVGCSHGTAVLEMQNMGYDAHGVDISAPAIEICKKREISNCFEQSVAKLDFDEAHFDAVITSDVLEHISEEELTDSLKNINRVLKKDGIAFATIATCPEGNRSFDKIAKKHGVENLHTLIKNYDFWKNSFSPFFDIEELVSKTEHSFFVLLRKRRIK